MLRWRWGLAYRFVRLASGTGNKQFRRSRVADAGCVCGGGLCDMDDAG